MLFLRVLFFKFDIFLKSIFWHFPRSYFRVLHFRDNANIIRQNCRKVNRKFHLIFYNALVLIQLKSYDNVYKSIKLYSIQLCDLPVYNRLYGGRDRLVFRVFIFYGVNIHTGEVV